MRCSAGGMQTPAVEDITFICRCIGRIETSVCWYSGVGRQGKNSPTTTAWIRPLAYGHLLGGSTSITDPSTPPPHPQAHPRHGDSQEGVPHYQTPRHEPIPAATIARNPLRHISQYSCIFIPTSQSPFQIQFHAPSRRSRTPGMEEGGPDPRSSLVEWGGGGGPMSHLSAFN